VKRKYNGSVVPFLNVAFGLHIAISVATNKNTGGQILKQSIFTRTAAGSFPGGLFG
jgi:hypothetical protein